MNLLKYIFAILVSVVFFTNNSIAVPKSNQGSSDTVVLQLKWKHQFQFAGYYAAIEKGYYSKAGLTVKLVEAEPGNASIPSVVKGEAQYGIAMSDLLLSRNAGNPVVLLANILQHSPHIFLALNHDKLDNIHDLAGKSIMLEHHATELMAYLKSEQISTKELDFISHAFTPEPLINGDVYAISAYSTDEPYLLINSGIEYSIFNPRAGGIDFYGDVLFTSEIEIRKHPDRVKAFLDASLKGWEYALENENEIIDLIYDKYSQRHTKEHLQFEAEQMKRLIMPEVIEIGYVNPNRWQRIGEIYADLGMLPDHFSLNEFIYDRNPKPSYWMISPIVFAILIITFCISFIAFRFYRLNQRLKNESNVLEEKEKQLKEANATKDKFFSIIAHDLKTSFYSLLGFSEILVEEIQDENIENIKKYTQQIYNVSNQSSALLNNLLDWSLTQTGGMKFNPEKVNFNEMTNELIDYLKNISHNKKMVIISDVSDNLELIADKNMLTTIIRNLGSNAIKYTPQGGGITISATVDNEGAKISVMDTGIGIKPEALGKLFRIEESISTRGTENEKGTGLGLILCKEFVEKHSGKIWVESKVGIGTKFTFNIPCKLGANKNTGVDKGS